MASRCSSIHYAAPRNGNLKDVVGDASISVEKGTLTNLDPNHEEYLLKSARELATVAALKPYTALMVVKLTKLREI